MNVLKSISKPIADILPTPLKIWFLRNAAILPSMLRSQFINRFAMWLSNQTDVNLSLNTNLGISDRYRYHIPVTMEPSLVWGKPEFYVQEYNSMLLAAVLSKYCAAFVDIGSYIGYYVFYVRNYMDDAKPIYYFEPIPEYFDIIQSNVESNRLPNVFGSRQALSNSNGEGVFYRNNVHSQCGSLTDRYINRDETEAIAVSLVTLVSLVESKNLRNLCVKVDVEGAEDLFLEGALGCIQEITYLIIEVLDSQSEFLRKAKTLGFEVYHITLDGLKYCPSGVDELVYGQWNWLFCKQKPYELQKQIIETGLRVFGN